MLFLVSPPLYWSFVSVCPAQFYGIHKIFVISVKRDTEETKDEPKPKKLTPAWIKAGYPKTYGDAIQDEMKNSEREVSLEIKSVDVYSDENGKAQLYDNATYKFVSTLVCDWESSRPCLCGKFTLFNMYWHMPKVLICCFVSYTWIDMAWGF